MSTRFLIYGLRDPRTHEIRYVGLSTRGIARPRQHIVPPAVLSAARKEMLARPDVKAKRSATLKKAFSTPEMRAKMSATAKAALASPEVRARISAATTAGWMRRKMEMASSAAFVVKEET